MSFDFTHTKISIIYSIIINLQTRKFSKAIKKSNKENNKTDKEKRRI